MQRQSYLQPFKHDKTGFCNKIISKLLQLLYLLVVGIPIIFYVISVFVLTIKRNFSIALSMLMVSMIHPILSVIFGLSIKSIRQVFSKICPNRIKSKYWKRLLTFSINVYLAFIGLVIFYMIMIDICLWKDYDYKNQSYDKCQCDDRRRNGLECENEDDNLQNYFNDFSIGYFILAFSSVSLTCHVIHSLTIAIPPPIPMIDFILGSKKEDTEENTNFIEMTSFNAPGTQSQVKENTKCKTISYICFKVLCFILSMALIGFIIASPYLKYVGQCPTMNETKASHYCQTTEKKHCTFPFIIENKIYRGCFKRDYSRIHDHVAWCAIDADEYGHWKSIGNCQQNCPGGK